MHSSIQVVKGKRFWSKQLRLYSTRYACRYSVLYGNSYRYRLLIIILPSVIINSSIIVRRNKISDEIFLRNYVLYRAIL